MSTPRTESIARLVHAVRGERVLFDADLAALYGVSTAALNQAVKRNRDRFPADFMFRLTAEEWAAMRSQIVTSSSGRAMMSQIVTSSRRKLVAPPQRAAFIASRGGEHRDHAHVRSATASDGFQSSPCTQDRGNGKEVRRAVRHGVRGDQAPYCGRRRAQVESQAPHRVHSLMDVGRAARSRHKL